MLAIMIKRVLLAGAFGWLCGIYLSPVTGLLFACLVSFAFGWFVPHRIWPLPKPNEENK